MLNNEYDLLVIGAGSGGVRAARMAAALGKKVAVVEDRYLGGTCVNVGCVPKKLFVYASHFSEDFHDAAAYGWTVQQPAGFNWATLRDNKTKEIERLNGVYADLLANSGAQLIEGHARLLDAHTVAVGDDEYKAAAILIAVGGWPFVPTFPGSEYAITSNEVFYLETLPKKLLIVGGGYIAVEFAGIFNGLGVATELAYRRDLFLRGFDQDVRVFVRDEMEKKGVQLSFNTDVQRIDPEPDGSLRVTLSGGRETVVDKVLYATGRKPKTEGLGLEAAGVQVSSGGEILVNERFQTNVPSIYALGDVVGRMQLTPVALAEAMALVGYLYQERKSPVNYELIPTAVFSQPNIGTVGFTEEQACAAGHDIDVYLSQFRPLKHTLSGSNERCLMKMIVSRENERVLGLHMVGAEAGEIMQGFAVALKAGATKTQFDQTIGIHPTAAEEFVTMRQPRKP